jgi:hypothetical protein
MVLCSGNGGIHVYKMCNFKISIQFLHYDMFRPLFLAIIRQYLYNPSQLSLLSPLHWSMFKIGGRSYCSLQCRPLVIDLNEYCKLYKLCPNFLMGVLYSQYKRISILHQS